MFSALISQSLSVTSKEAEIVAFLIPQRERAQQMSVPEKESLLIK